MFFFGRIYAIEGVAKVCTLEIGRNFEFSSGSIFGLRPFQKKNPREKTIFSARCARRQQQGGGKNKRKSFLILVSSDRKPQKGVFLPKLGKNKARGARAIFFGCFSCERSEHAIKWWKRGSKSVHFGEGKVVAKVCALAKKH